MGEERILVTVRTYPNISAKYTETVCTGGINQDGEWRRLHPVPLRYLGDDKQFRTYDVITLKVQDHSSDGRPESRRPDLSTLKVVEKVTDWSARRDWILKTAAASLRELKESSRTLGPVKVSKVLEFIAEPDDADWSPKQLELLRQMELYSGPTPLEKLPFDFRVRWVDGEGAEYDSKLLAWEVGQTWRRFRQRYPQNTIEMLRDALHRSYFDEKKDRWFFMGNYAKHREYFGVCGMFSPPKESSPSDPLF
jgi:hypothetical protein